VLIAQPEELLLNHHTGIKKLYFKADLMIKSFKLIVFSIIMPILLADYQIIAQSRTAEDVRNLLAEYCKNLPREEIYAHTDRESYVAGEELWFSAFLFDRQSGSLSSKSVIAYFELLNPDNVAVIQKRFLISDGICPGNAHLPDTLTSGTYTLRVYTNWMKNFLPENAFMKNISIINPFRSNGFKQKMIFEEHLPLKINIGFYPEGGTLLNGIAAKIAVRVTDEYQQGLAFKGTIRDNRGDSVTYFSTNSFGLASFDITPVSGNRYYVLHSGTLTYIPLASDEGCSLKADYLGKDLVTMTISEKGNTYSSGNQDYSMLIQSRGNVSYFETFRIQGNSKSIIISKSGLAEGINHITLFSQNQKPLCERLIFISHKETSKGPEIEMPDQYTRREKVKMNIDMGPVKTVGSLKQDLSISVVPLALNLNFQDLDDYLVFGTEFGYLPWISNDGKATGAGEDDYDNFLIGAKSRWITWDDIFSGHKVPLSYRMEENVHFLSGMIRERDTKVSENGYVLSLSIPGKVASFYSARSDKEGHFEFMLPVDQVQRNFIIQPGSPDKNISIQIQSPYSWSTPSFFSYKDTLRSGISPMFSDLGAHYQVSRIFDAAVKEEVLPDNIIEKTGKRFYGIPEIELIMDDYIKLPVMQEIFFELTPGVKLRERKSGYEMKILNPFTGSYYDEPPTVLIDGVIVNDLSAVANLDPELVERIEIVKTPYLTGELIHHGIVHIITKQGKYSNLSLPDYVVKLPYRVTEPVSLFSSPDYSNPGRRQNRVPDFRNTLYWNPSIKSDNEGKMSVEFFTSDLTGDYVINIQGVNANGNPVSIRKIIKVN
jgi:hypothetical protein